MLSRGKAQEGPGLAGNLGIEQLRGVLILSLWWLILCINRSVLRGAQRAGNALFPGVSGRVFLEKISTWISRLYKDRPHTSMGGHNPICGGSKWTKRQRKHESALWTGSSIFSCPWTSVLLAFGLRWNLIFAFPHSQAFWLRLELHCCLPQASSLQSTDQGSSPPLSSSHELVLHNETLSMYVYISYWFWILWGTVTYESPLSFRVSASHPIMLPTFTDLLSISPTGKETSLWVRNSSPDRGLFYMVKPACNAHVSAIPWERRGNGSVHLLLPKVLGSEYPLGGKHTDSLTSFLAPRVRETTQVPKCKLHQVDVGPGYPEEKRAKTRLHKASALPACWKPRTM